MPKISNAFTGGSINKQSLARYQQTLASGHEHHRPGTIVGAETPEKIPTDVAVALMLRLIASQNARGNDGARVLTVYFEDIGRITGKKLTEGDQKRVVSPALEFQQNARPTKENRSSYEQIRRTAAIQAWAQLSEQLSPVGWEGLQTYAEVYAKRKIKRLN